MAEVDYFAAIDALNRRSVTLLPELHPYWQRYMDDVAQSAMMPLIVECEVLTPLAGYHPLTLDGLLAWAVVKEAMRGSQLDNSGTPYLLPIPLKLLWRSNGDNGMPLWAANWFQPTTANRKISVYWHKRMIRPEYADDRKDVPKSNISEVMGRFKEKRIPMPAQIATRWQAECIGDPVEISRLLSTIDAVGKKRYALVKQWSIRLADSFAFNRFVPVAYTQQATGSFTLDMQMAAWTPPYWDGVPECRALCCIPS